MKFHYVASTQQGTLQEGNEEGGSTAELLALLASRGLKPISIKQLHGENALTYGKVLRGRSITINDKIFLSKYLSIMLKVGIDLFQAINILLADFQRSTLRSLLAEIRENLERGQPFYATFQRYPQYFSNVFVNLIRAGETSGNLDDVFADLTESLEKEKSLRSKIKGALVYPALLFGMSILILIFLTTFALPKLANVFSGGGFEPPAFSKAVFAVGLFINKYVWAVFGLTIVAILALWIFSKSKPGRAFIDLVMLKTPILKKIVYTLAVRRFATTLASLLRAGVPILEALRITADTVGHPNVRDGLLRIANEGVAKGLTLGEAFRKETVFPFVVTNLVAISEKAGHLDEILETLGRFYDTEVEASIKNAVTFLEPAMLFFIGIVIATIALAIIVPVYQLVGKL